MADEPAAAPMADACPAAVPDTCSEDVPVKLIFRLTEPSASDSASDTWGRLYVEYEDSSRNIDYEATSGVAGGQVSGREWTSGGRVPSTRELGYPYYVWTQFIPAAEINSAEPGLGDGVQMVYPREVKHPTAACASSTTTAQIATNCPDGVTKPVRRQIEIHQDANNTTNPGSAGCVVVKSASDWESFKSRMLEANCAGIDYIELEVIYVPYPYETCEP